MTKLDVESGESVQVIPDVTAYGGLWKVRIKGETVSLVDDYGRERFRGTGLANVAAALVMSLSKEEFRSHETVDELLRDAAESFGK